MDFVMVLIVSILATAFVYLIFPIVYRIVTGGVDAKKASTLALINSIVVFIIFTIIYACLNKLEIASVPAAYTYYWIAKAILTKKEKAKTNSEIVGEIEKEYGVKPFECKDEQEEIIMKEIIKIGSIVTIYDEEIGEETYKIVSAKSGKDENEIHISAPLAQALVGHTVGEEVTVKAENEYKIKIIKVGGTKMQIPETHRRSNRNIYFVFQGLQAEHEITGGYLFAVCREEIAHYRRLKRLKKGDIVIHCYKQHIVAVSEVTKECRVEKRPAAHYLANDLKDASGWMVDVKCRRLRRAINVSNYKDKIIHFQGDAKGKGYPFNCNGTGNQGYLFNLDRELALFFIKEIIYKNSSIAELDYIQDVIHNETQSSEYKALYWCNQNSKVVVCQYTKRVCIGLIRSFLMFTLEENIDREKMRLKDFTKMKEIPNCDTYKKAKSFLIQHYGFKPENITELDGKENARYTLGSFND